MSGIARLVFAALVVGACLFAPKTVGGIFTSAGDLLGRWWGAKVIDAVEENQPTTTTVIPAPAATP